MKRQLRYALIEELTPPAPVKKEAFLRSVRTPSISGFTFLCQQAAYIRKRIWILSVLLFAVSLFGAAFLEKNMLWCICSFMPLLALSVITESGRSETFGMAELELSTRFSLRSVVLARLGILGTANLLLLCLLLPLAFMNSRATLLQTALYMMCPYLLTAFSGLWTMRRIRGRESVFLCAGIAVCISFGNILIHQAFPSMYDGIHLLWWAAALMLCTAGAVRQCCGMIKQTEELTWNL